MIISSQPSQLPDTPQPSKQQSTLNPTLSQPSKQPLTAQPTTDSPSSQPTKAPVTFKPTTRLPSSGPFTLVRFVIDFIRFVVVCVLSLTFICLNF